jgi:peptide-methionine (S)-S-oxide reductase
MMRYLCLLLAFLRPFDGPSVSVSGFSPALTLTRTRIVSVFVDRSPHDGHRSPSVWSPLAASNDAENDSSNFLSKIPRPTLNQVLLVWLVGVAGNRLLQAFPKLLGGYSADSNILPNIALNGALFAVGLYLFARSLIGIDYSKLEGLDTKSSAKEAGKLALEGKVPTEYVAEDGSVYQVATFAGGCFWGTELRYQRQVGVIATAVGYTQGNVDKPNYEQVCSGSTGHTEGIQLIYDPSVVSYERLVNILLDSVDPTQLNRVGNDRGTQYRHGIYPHTDEQMTTARARIESRQSQYTSPIVTEVKQAEVFWPAENYHQRYLEKGGQSAEKNCDERIRCYG